jgi:hypothetical protein
MTVPPMAKVEVDGGSLTGTLLSSAHGLVVLSDGQCAAAVAQARGRQ